MQTNFKWKHTFLSEDLFGLQLEPESENNSAVSELYFSFQLKDCNTQYDWNHTSSRYWSRVILCGLLSMRFGLKALLDHVFVCLTLVLLWIFL